MDDDFAVADRYRLDDALGNLLWQRVTVNPARTRLNWRTIAVRCVISSTGRPHGGHRTGRRRALLVGAIGDLGLLRYGPRSAEAHAKQGASIPVESSEADSRCVEFDATATYGSLLGADEAGVAVPLASWRLRDRPEHARQLAVDRLAEVDRLSVVLPSEALDFLDKRTFVGVVDRDGFDWKVAAIDVVNLRRPDGQRLDFETSRCRLPAQRAVLLAIRSSCQSASVPS